MFMNKFTYRFFLMVDNIFRYFDKQHIRRTRNILNIPDFPNRRGGKLSYAEWAHVIGIFQTLMYNQAYSEKGIRVLDVGCGTGLLSIAAHPMVLNRGAYIGLDVNKADIDFYPGNWRESPVFIFRTSLF